MKKEDILLKNFTVLSQNPVKHYEALEDLLIQLLTVNPKVAIKCWEELIKQNMDELENDFYLDKYCSNVDFWIVQQLENKLLKNENFVYALPFFVKSKFLLDIIYTKLPIYEYASVYYAIAYAIKNDDLKTADLLLSYIYKNKKFKNYSKLWNNIVGEFRYCNDDHYSGGGLVSDSNYKKPEHIQEFCISWIQRIIDEEEQAGAMTHAMRIF